MADHLNPLEAEQRQRRLLLGIVRAFFVLLVVGVTLLTMIKVATDAGAAQRAIPFENWWVVGFTAAIVLSAVVLLVDVFTPQKRLSTISGVLFGIVAGGVVAFALGYIVDLLVVTWISDTETYNDAQPLITTVKILLGISLSYFAVSTVLQTQDDFRLVIPYVEFAKQVRGSRPLLLDSSALIDARIAELAQTGVIQTPLIIPKFVVSELQLLADSGEKLKRARGRRGLDIIARLQRSVPDVTIDSTPAPGNAVDQMLVELARRMPATIVTTDSGLTRVAQIHNVPVINVHDIANAMKPALVPGERLQISLVKTGEQPGQAVGYLEDGTMVVCEDSAPMIGTKVEVQVTSSLQTSAGRLIFAKPVEDPDAQRESAEHAAGTNAGGQRAQSNGARAAATARAADDADSGDPEQDAPDDPTAAAANTEPSASPPPARSSEPPTPSPRRRTNARNPRR